MHLRCVGPRTPAIVETAGEHYFFKMTGPSATVKAAQKPFEAMIDGVAPPKR